MWRVERPFSNSEPSDKRGLYATREHFSIWYMHISVMHTNDSLTFQRAQQLTRPTGAELIWIRKYHRYRSTSRCASVIARCGRAECNSDENITENQQHFRWSVSVHLISTIIQSDNLCENRSSEAGPLRGEFNIVRLTTSHRAAALASPWRKRQEAPKQRGDFSVCRAESRHVHCDSSFSRIRLLKSHRAKQHPRDSPTLTKYRANIIIIFFRTG